MVEVIWDYLSDNRRKVFKNVDFKPNNGKANEGYDYIDYTVFDELLEDFFNDEYNEETEYEYDCELITEERVLTFEDYLRDLED